MGIKHLYQLIQEHAPAAVKAGEIKNQFGRKVAIVCRQKRITRCIS
jgi:flap endonuclease-1